MDLSTSRRQKQLTPLTRDNKRLLPGQVHVPSVLHAPRSFASRDCDARQRRSARPGCKGELDRELLLPREAFLERRSRRHPWEKTPGPHIAPEPANRRRRGAATQIQYLMMGCIRSIEPSPGFFLAAQARLENKSVSLSSY